MSHTIVSTPPTTAMRRWWSRAWNDPDTRSTMIGILGVLLIHALLWLLGPRLMRFEGGAVPVRPHSTAREFNIELAPDTFIKPQPKAPQDPFRFVETNPDAPENIPDKTNNFGAQNQQVAQPVPTPDGKSDRPATEGKKDFESTQIVSGRLTQPIEHIEAVPPAPPTQQPVAEQQVAAPKLQQNPLPGDEKIEGDNKDGIGTGLAKRLENARAVPEKIEGAKDGREYDGPNATQFAIDPKRPRPRPQVVRQQQVRPAVLADNKFGTQNVGVIGIDAKWSNYGVYLQRMIEAVQIKWDGLVAGLTANPAINSVVTVKFVMDSEGKIAQIVNVETSANETATAACLSAITDRAPYGPWTDDMKAVLGDRQEMTFSFHYW